MPASLSGLTGYDSLALLMGRYPELAVFRKFGKLSMKCLLYKQAEITHLEAEQDVLSKKNCADAEKCTLARSWYDFAQSGAPDEEVNYQRQKMDEIHQKIQEYQTMLIQTTEIFRLKAPQGCELTTLKDWLGRPDGGDHFLKGRENNPWEDENQGDVVSLLSSAHSDTFAQQIWSNFLPWYHKHIGWRRKPHVDEELGRIWEYSTKSFTLAGNVLCVLLSFAIPTGSIFALYFVRSMQARLLMMAGFILVFACAMMFVVGCRRGEVFAATAAFAAIQVVFVGGVNIIQQR